MAVTKMQLTKIKNKKYDLPMEVSRKYYLLLPLSRIVLLKQFFCFFLEDFTMTKRGNAFNGLLGISITPHLTASQDKQAPTYLTERRKIERVRREVVITTLGCMFLSYLQ